MNFFEKIVFASLAGNMLLSAGVWGFWMNQIPIVALNEIWLIVNILLIPAGFLWKKKTCRFELGLMTILLSLFCLCGNTFLLLFSLSVRNENFHAL